MNIDIRYDVEEQKVFFISAFLVDVRIKVYSHDGTEYVENYNQHMTLEPYINHYVTNNFFNRHHLKVEIWDPKETFIIRECIFKDSSIKQKPKICVISPIKNEIAILPFFMDYYFNFVKVDKIIFSDGGSDDGSIEYIKSFGEKTEIISEDHAVYNEYNLMKSRNTIWKKYKGEYDWFIIADADEFLYHPNIREKIQEYISNGITVPTTKGYEMMSQEFPTFTPGVYLPDIIKMGKKKFGLDKHIIFNGKEVDMKYSFGSHQSFPSGNVVYNTNPELCMLHYKFLSLDYVRDKGAFGLNRRSKQAEDQEHAVHWVFNSKISENEYNGLFNECEIVI
jgi:hypothetical protein